MGIVVEWWLGGWVVGGCGCGVVFGGWVVGGCGCGACCGVVVISKMFWSLVECTIAVAPLVVPNVV